MDNSGLFLPVERPQAHIGAVFDAEESANSTAKTNPETKRKNMDLFPYFRSGASMLLNQNEISGTDWERKRFPSVPFRSSFAFGSPPPPTPFKRKNRRLRGAPRTSLSGG